MGRGDLALKAARAEAAGNEQAGAAGQQFGGGLVFKILGFDPVQFHFRVVERAGVHEGLR